MKDHNLEWKKKKWKRKEQPPRQKQKVEEIEPVIAEHVSQCTATSFC
jgi:hypothetical protein